MACLSLCFGGCNLHADLDSVHYLGADVSGALANDSGVDSGEGAGVDSGGDSGDGAGLDSGEGDGAGEVDGAGDADVTEAEDACDILNGSACTDGLRCVFDTDMGRNRCVSVDGIAGGVEGDACASYADCGGDLVCVDWAHPDPRGSICSKPCSIETADGCGSNQFCAATDLAVGEEVGFCTKECDVLDSAQRCAEWERCVPDPFEPEAAFPSHFRCLLNDDGGLQGDGSPAKSMSSLCSGAQLHENGCPAGLTCLPVLVDGTRGEYCLEPCRTGAAETQCVFFQSLNRCEAIPEASQLGYCK